MNTQNNNSNTRTGAVRIPIKWALNPNESAWYITYYGELYYGILTECPNYDEGFFIVQNDKIKELQDLESTKRTPKRYRELGREIRDSSIIIGRKVGQFGREIDFSSHPQTNNETFKRMFVFGAGASKYCVTKKDYEYMKPTGYWPPMGDDVFGDQFSELLMNYPGAYGYATNTIKDDGSAVGMNIEEQMQADWNQFKYYMNPEKLAAHINIQFYLAELLQRSSEYVLKTKTVNNLYSLFLKNLKSVIDNEPKERMSLVTFNYDTILDTLVTESFGYNFQSLHDYRNWPERNILLFKPHGSCNWGWKMNGELPVGLNQSNLGDLLYHNQTSLSDIYFKMIGELENVVANNTWGFEYHNDPHFRGRLTLDKSLIQHISPSENELFYPAILIPYKNKDEFFMPYDHFYAMKQIIEHVEELYLIGWKGSEALFNKQLKQMSNLKKLIIVNPEARKVHDIISPFIGAKDYQVECVDSFEEFVLDWMPKHFEI